MTKASQPIPPGHEGLIPHLVCDPCAAAIEFYKKAFGAQELNRAPAPDGRRIMHAAMRIGSGVVFLVDDFPEFCGGKASSPKALNGTPVTIHRYVEDCDAAIKRAADAGATVQMPAARHVLGRPLRRGDRSVRPQLVIRDACQGSDARGNGGGHEGGVRAAFVGSRDTTAARGRELADSARRRRPSPASPPPAAGRSRFPPREAGAR